MIRAWVVSLGFVMASSTLAAPAVQRIDGVLMEFTADRLTLQSNGEIYEFTRGSKIYAFPTNLRVGDQVTIWYTQEIQSLRIERSRQQPGEAPSEVPGIIDDRAFYHA